MRYVSLFSGIEAATVAWEPLGFEPVAFSEIDPFCCQLLQLKYPEVPNVGDITKVKWGKYRGKVDIVIGGSPCQSFSIAGKREGRAGESGLMAEYIRAVREIRPRYFIWENVKGSLTVESGEAFRQLLSEMDNLGYGLAWRVCDAQFWGLAQRRERVFLVGSLGDMRSAEILFDEYSLRWDHPSSREERKRLAADAESRSGSRGVAGFKYHQGPKAGNIGYAEEQSPTLTADYHNPAVLTPWDCQSKRVYSPDGVSPTLQAGDREGGGIQPIVMSTANTGANGSNISGEGVSYTLDGANSNAIAVRADSTPKFGEPGGPYHTLRDGGSHNAVCIQGSMVGRSDENGPQGSGIDDDLSFTLNTVDRHAVAFAQNTRNEVKEFDDEKNLNSQEPIVIDWAAFNQGENAQYTPHIGQSDVMDTLVAKGPHAVCRIEEDGERDDG